MYGGAVFLFIVWLSHIGHISVTYRSHIGHISVTYRSHIGHISVTVASRKPAGVIFMVMLIVYGIVYIK